MKQQGETMEKNAIVWIFIAAAAVILIGSLGMGGYSMMGFGMGAGFLFMLLFWGLIIWLIVVLTRSGSQTKKEEPMTLLKRRYASGEITKKQYEEMKKELYR